MAFSQNTAVFSSLSREEESQLLAFKKEAFYSTGEDFENFNRWQEFLNLFFIYHVRSGDGQTTLARRRELPSAQILLYTPSFFNRMKGTDYFSESPLAFDDEARDDLGWFDRRELILSIFDRKEDQIHFVQAKASFVVSLKHLSFFQKVKKLADATPAYQNGPYLLFLISILLLKKDRFASSKLFDPFRIEELEKAHLYYQKFADTIVS